jgi:hypothetical protein
MQWLGLGPGGRGRRRAHRIPCSLEATYGVTATIEGDTWPAIVRNICVDGLGLVVSKPFEEGSRLRVTLHNETKSVTRTLIIRVIYALEHPSGDWIMGGAFTRQLSGADLHMLLE